MNRIILILTLIFLIFSSCFVENKLEEKEQVLELEYIAWACACANWVTTEDRERYENDENSGDALSNLTFFIEEANKSLILPDTLGYANDIIRFTGRFYKKKGFPKGVRTEPEEHLEKAKIFRYTKYEVVKSNFADIKKSLNEE